MLRRSIKLLGVLVASTALVFGAVGSASAAPTLKGHTEVSSGLLDLAEFFGLLRVEAIAPASRIADNNVYSFPVVGNWQMGTVKQVGGQLVTNAGTGEQIAITNLWQHEDMTVSGIINGGDRMTLFIIEQTGEHTGTLHFTAAGAGLFNDFLGLPILAEGAVFGTAVQTLSWPNR